MYVGPGTGSIGSGTGIGSVFSTGTRVLPQPGATLGETRNKTAPLFRLERAALRLAHWPVVTGPGLFWPKQIGPISEPLEGGEGA